ncbi:hypothetical protein UA08_00397 [Talaromyces atroroseus]|uniref:Uncharacterized protein n=1 Tax=Talaromyces atroroseus TaxID=1441469 RepID=A0A225BE09_TALAT|nr:hypothetical protein UA08_00397 [Talaromyces atroroseus]OKL64257.1 hypothetical protein UA08_00397 [Talaromyces atroroseus]
MAATKDIEHAVHKDPRRQPSNSSQEFKFDPASQILPGSSLQQREGDDSSSSLEPSPRTVHGWKWAAAATSLYIGALIYGLDGTVAADIQTAVIEQFGEVESLTWIGTGFPLGSVCSILPGAALYAIVDLKSMFIGSIILFEAASALCGAAPTMNALIVGRALAGVGGNGIFLGILNYFALCTAEQERGRYISGMGVTWGMGAVLGPVVGGAFATSSATWRWAFYINLVVAALCAPVYIFYLPSVKPGRASDTPILGKLVALDWVGFILGTRAMVSFTIALTFAGTTWSWDDGRTIATIVVSGVLFILTFLQQYFVVFTTREARMFPPRHVLLNMTQVLLYINTAVAAANIYIPLYYIPIYFSFAHGDSTLMAAVRLLPFIAFLASMTMVSGSLLPRINYYWVLYTVGGVLMTVGSATMYTVNPNTSIANVYGYTIMLGAGTGLVFNLGFTVASITIMAQTGSDLDVQRVSSMQNLSQLGFQTVSLLIGGQIFQSFSMKNLTHVLNGQGFSQEDIRSVIMGTQSALFDSLNPSLQTQAIKAITDAISKVYILSIVSGAIMLIVVMVMPKGKLFPAKEDTVVPASGA